MSDHHDQSYYEIALTNRQVMSIFVVLLLAVLAAFLGGVWLGKGADGAVEVASAQSMAAGVTPGESPLEELDFFARRDPESLAETSPEPLPSDSVAKEPDPGPEKTAAPSRRSRPAENNERPPKEREAPAEPTKVTQPAPQPSVAEPEETQPRPESSPVAAAATAVPDFVVIQVFSSNDESQARRVVNRLRKGGYPAILSPVEVEGRILHRVRIGPYTDRDEARVVAQSVERTFKLDTWITN